MPPESCYVCGKAEPEELRPYGKDGQIICYDCMIADPEREAEAKRQIDKRFDAIDGPVVIGENDGPISIGEAMRRMKERVD